MKYPSTTLAFVLTALLACAAPAAEPAPPAKVKITNPRVRAVPKTATATAAYMIIENLTDQPIKLVGGSAEFAGLVEPMITTTSASGMKGMETVPELEIPARGQRELKPGGDHLMLMKLKSHPVAGQPATFVLRFQPGDVTVTVTAPVFR
ncbi:MAG: copper chaperone PCu(A)C [Verrucomicrobia bacterium]|nr:copper chaperone PCu(A)C [Verrucomicrobiota bacterium]